MQPRSQCRWFVGQAVDFDFARRCSKGPFIATQLNSTQVDVQLTWVQLRRYKRPFRPTHDWHNVIRLRYTSWCLCCAVFNTCVHFAIGTQRRAACDNCEWDDAGFCCDVQKCWAAAQVSWAASHCAANVVVAETSPHLHFYHFHYSGTSLLSIVGNSSNVSYALSAMDAVLWGKLQFSSKCQLQHLGLFSIHLFSIILPRGSVRVQE